MTLTTEGQLKPDPPRDRADGKERVMAIARPSIATYSE